MLTIENRAGVDVLVMGNGCRPASEAEIAFYAEAQRLRDAVDRLTYAIVDMRANAFTPDAVRKLADKALEGGE